MKQNCFTSSLASLLAFIQIPHVNLLQSSTILRKYLVPFIAITVGPHMPMCKRSNTLLDTGFETGKGNLFCFASEHISQTKSEETLILGNAFLITAKTPLDKWPNL